MGVIRVANREELSEVRDDEKESNVHCYVCLETKKCFR